MTYEEIAKVAYQTYREYLKNTNSTTNLLDWDECPDWEKKSAIIGVRTYINNPEDSIEKNHERWMKERLTNNGVYYTERDKISFDYLPREPIPFLQLSKKLQVKDFIFQNVVYALT